MTRNLVTEKLASVLLAGSSGWLIYGLATGSRTGWGWAALAAVDTVLSFGLMPRAMLAEVLP